MAAEGRSKCLNDLISVREVQRFDHGIQCRAAKASIMWLPIGCHSFLPPIPPTPPVYVKKRKGPVSVKMTKIWRRFALSVTGAVCTAAGGYIQNYAQQHLPAVRATILIDLTPLFAAVFGLGRSCTEAQTEPR